MPSPYKPIEICEGTFEVFDLPQVRKELTETETFRKSGRVARTLVRSDQMTAVLTALAAGAEIHEHNSVGPILISVLSGVITVSVETQNAKRNLPAGSAAVLSPDCAHRVVGESDSVFLIVFGGRTSAGPS